MTFGLESSPARWVFVAAAARVDTGTIYYAGLAVVVVVVMIALVAFYRTWSEINEDEAPDTPADLLESFREAHAAGQIDDRELDRVQDLLIGGTSLAPSAKIRSRPGLIGEEAADDPGPGPVGGPGPGTD